jgi:cell division septal protein FtsQ
VRVRRRRTRRPGRRRKRKRRRRRKRKTRRRRKKRSGKRRRMTGVANVFFLVTLISYSKKIRYLSVPGL